MDKDQAPSEFVLYNPPKSTAFGHQARIRDPRRAWESVERFIEKWTNGKYEDDGEFKAVSFGDENTQIYTEYYEFVRSLLGPETGATERTWKVPPESLPTILNACYEEDRWPRLGYGPARMRISYSFKWKDGYLSTNGENVITPTILSDSSHISLVVGSQRVFIQPFLVIPSAWNSLSTLEFIEKIETDTPFRLREQNFKRMIETKSGFGGYRTRKLKKGWRAESKASILGK